MYLNWNSNGMWLFTCMDVYNKIGVDLEFGLKQCIYVQAYHSGYSSHAKIYWSVYVFILSRIVYIIDIIYSTCICIYRLCNILVWIYVQYLS